MGAEHRKLPRRKVEQLVLMTSDNGLIIGQCIMLDVSAGGARLKLNGDFAVPEQFTLFLSKIDGRLKRRCVIAPEQRTVIRDYVVKEKIRPYRMQSRVTVGATLPAEVELARVPETWGPTFRSYRYVYTGDDVVLVDPSEPTRGRDHRLTLTASG